jgi:hypothetical protein
MTATSNALTRSEEIIMEMMEELSPSDPRYQVLEAALAFKASWVILAQHLNNVLVNKMHIAWGYKNFGQYCQKEIRVTAATAKKMVRGYQWLDEEAPEIIQQEEDGKIKPVREVPDFRTVGILADARKALQADRVDKKSYDALKESALAGQASATELRREFKAHLPPAPQLPSDRDRSLRRALSTVVKTLEYLREWDGSDDLLIQAEELRKEVAANLPKKNAA